MAKTSIIATPGLNPRRRNGIEHGKMCDDAAGRMAVPGLPAKICRNQIFRSAVRALLKSRLGLPYLHDRRHERPTD